MKKILVFIILIILIVGGYFVYKNYFSGIPKLEVEEEKIDIHDIFIYGTHLNFSGDLVDDENLDIVLYNGDFTNYSINKEDDSFNISSYVNEGILLDNLSVGKYYIFLRSTNKVDDKESYKYYVLNNKTKYKDMTYYTFNNIGNKITVSTDSEYNTLVIDVNKNSDKDIYDIVIDPGHGGMDSGAIKNGTYEADLSMKIALDLKKKLEKNGFKIKLTREEGQLSKNEKLNDYGEHGRAVIPFEVKAKYLFSIHLNSNISTRVHGIELYTPDNINYDFIKSVANNLTKDKNIVYSTNKINKVFDGIYTRTFTKYDIEESKKGFIEKNMEPYDVTEKSNYYYMIRETGGIVTGAYVDDRNKENPGNPYFDSNVSTESYLLELGYLSNDNDYKYIINHIDSYTSAIANSFTNFYTNNE